MELWYVADQEGRTVSYLRFDSHKQWQKNSNTLSMFIIKLELSVNNTTKKYLQIFNIQGGKYITGFSGVCFLQNDKSPKIKPELSFPVFFSFKRNYIQRCQYGKQKTKPLL